MVGPQSHKKLMVDAFNCELCTDFQHRLLVVCIPLHLRPPFHIPFLSWQDVHIRLYPPRSKNLRYSTNDRMRSCALPNIFRDSHPHRIISGQHSQFQTMGTAWNMNLPHNFQVVLYIKISWSSPVPEKSSAGWRCLCCTATFWPALCWEASTSGVLVLMPMSHFGNSTSRQDFPDFLKICWYFLDSWWLLMQSCWGDVCQLCHMLFLCG